MEPVICPEPRHPLATRIALAALTGMIVACHGATPDHDSASLEELVDDAARQEIRCHLDEELGSYVVELRVPSRSSRFGVPDSVRCTGIVVDDGKNREVVRFDEAETEPGERVPSPRNRAGAGPPPDVLRVPTVPGSGHDVSLEISPDPHGGFHVRVRDRITLRRSVAGVELIWEFPERLSRCEVLAPDPQPTPGREELCGLDETFRHGAAMVRCGPSAVTLHADLDQLANDRLLPSVLRVEGVGRHTHVVHGLRAPGGAVSLRDEVLSFAHRVQFVADAPADLRAATIDATWSERVPELLGRSPAPLDGSLGLDDLADEILGGIRRRPTILLDRRAGRIEVAPDYQDEFSASIVLGLDGHFLLDAEAMARAGHRKQDAELLRRGRDAAEFALAASWRSGLAPYGWSRRSGWERWLESDPHGSSPSSYRAADSAWILLRLASIAEVVPEIRERVDARAEDFAGFLLQNQLTDPRRAGTIPAYYESTWLAPADGERWTSAAHQAFLCWFLADHMVRRHRDDPKLARALDGAFVLVRSAVLDRRAVAFESDSNEGRGSTLALTAACRAAALIVRAQSSPTGPSPAAPPVESAGGRPAPAAPAPAAPMPTTPDARAVVQACTEALAELQSCWSPPWRTDAVVGGFAHDDGSPDWNSAATPHAAVAMLEGWHLLGGRSRLERAATGLRAGLLSTAPGAGLAVIERVQAELGHAVAEISEGYAATFTTAWFEKASAQPGGRIALAPTIWKGGPSSVRVRLVDRSGAVPAGVTVGDQRFDLPASPAAPVVEVPTRTVPKLDYAPPTALRTDSTWIPRARYSGPIDEAHFTVRIADPLGREEAIALLPDADHPGLLTGVVPFVPNLDWDGRLLRTDLVCELPGRRTLHPLRAAREIVLGAFDSIEFGNSLEFGVRAEPAAHTVLRFPSGRENARRLDPAVPLEVNLAVPPDSPSVTLRLRISGELRITAGDREVFETSPAPSDAPRTVEVELADPRLWHSPSTEEPPKGLRLELTRIPNAAESSIARLEWRSALPPTPRPSMPISIAEPEPRVPSRIDALIVPLCPPEPALWVESEPLRQAFFAGPEYRVVRAADGKDALTAGSAREWLKALSGGLTSLEGEVLERIVTDPTAFESPPARLTAAMPHLRGAIAQRAEIPDLVILVTASADLRGARYDLLQTIGELHPRAARPRPVIVMELPAGEPPACGDLVEALLDALGVLQHYDDPVDGNLGALALTGSATPCHQPPAPVGLNLERAGWIDVLRAGDRASAPDSVVLAPLVRGRVALECSTDDLPRGERLWFEARGAVPAEGLLANHHGLLLLRRFEARSRPTYAALDGQVVRPEFVRIPAGSSEATAPFRPGTPADLLPSISRLDGRSRPSIANVEGEAPWHFRDVRCREDGICEFTPVWQGAELLDPTNPPTAHHRNAGGEPMPLELDGVDRRGLGSAGFDGSTLRLAPTAPGTDFEVSLRRADHRGPARAFVDLQVASAPARLRISSAGRILLEAVLPPGARWAECLLPPSDEARSLDITVAAIDGPTVLALRRVTTVPVEVARTALRDLDQVTAFLFDGTMAPAAALPADGRRIEVPVLLPKGESALTLRASLPAGAKTPIRLSATLREFESGASIPILRGLALEPTAESGILRLRAQLPARDEDRAAVLEIWAEGAEGGLLAIPDLAIAR